jgi:hypothetical protein
MCKVGRPASEGVPIPRDRLGASASLNLTVGSAGDDSSYRASNVGVRFCLLAICAISFHGHRHAPTGQRADSPLGLIRRE